VTFHESLADDIFAESRHVDALHTALYGAEHEVGLLADEQEVLENLDAPAEA